MYQNSSNISVEAIKFEVDEAQETHSRDNFFAELRQQNDIFLSAHGQSIFRIDKSHASQIGDYKLTNYLLEPTSKTFNVVYGDYDLDNDLSFCLHPIDEKRFLRIKNASSGRSDYLIQKIDAESGFELNCDYLLADVNNSNTHGTKPQYFAKVKQHREIFVSPFKGYAFYFLKSNRLFIFLIHLTIGNRSRLYSFDLNSKNLFQKSLTKIPIVGQNKQTYTWFDYSYFINFYEQNLYGFNLFNVNSARNLKTIIDGFKSICQQNVKTGQIQVLNLTNTLDFSDFKENKEVRKYLINGQWLDERFYLKINARPYTNLFFVLSLKSLIWRQIEFSTQLKCSTLMRVTNDENLILVQLHDFRASRIREQDVEVRRHWHNSKPCYNEVELVRSYQRYQLNLNDGTRKIDSLMKLSLLEFKRQFGEGSQKFKDYAHEIQRHANF